VTIRGAGHFVEEDKGEELGLSCNGFRRRPDLWSDYFLKELFTVTRRHAVTGDLAARIAQHVRDGKIFEPVLSFIEVAGGRGTYAAKICAVVVLSNAAGVVIYRAGQKRSQLALSQANTSQ
jgi:hypothetical protein